MAGAKLGIPPDEEMKAVAKCFTGALNPGRKAAETAKAI
jgi:hypothetical protein